MSHVTQCPACRTHFRVVADQLKISDGWVRCGQCGEVFDARVSMQPWPLQHSPVAPNQAEPVPTEARSEVIQEPESGPLSTVTDVAEQVEPVEQPGAESADRPAAKAVSPVPDDIAPSLAFVRNARRRAAWRSPWVRALGTASGLVLALVLVVQVLVHERHYLAAAHPDWLPVLQHICEPLACTIEPDRQIESVLIDSSALVRERDDLYRLEVGLKNTSGRALAVPALELSLTDSEDDVVLRRVLLPADWGGAVGVLMPHATLALSLHLTLSGASELRMSGYRALVFYP